MYSNIFIYLYIYPHEYAGAVAAAGGKGWARERGLKVSSSSAGWVVDGFLAGVEEDEELKELQCVAVCCSVLLSVAVCRSVLQCVTVCCSVLRCAVCCSAW